MVLSYLNSSNFTRYDERMDATDLIVSGLLQAQGRMTNVELARQAGLAPSTTLERVRRLEERGVIRGYHARLDPHALGLQVQAMVQITLNRHEPGVIDTFEAQVKGVPEVKACYHVTGQYDYILHVVVRDIDHLRELATHTLAALRGLEKQETFLILSTIKEDEGYALESVRADRTGKEEA